MNKKILMLLVSVLAVALLAIPVMGAPATKIEGVILTDVGIPVRYTHPGYPLVVDHTIAHSKGNTTNTITLTIPKPEQTTPLVLEGSWYSEWISRSKISPEPTETELLIQGKVVMTFTGLGTFEGKIYRTILGTPPDMIQSMYTRMVLHGTGDFRGQTLKFVDGNGYLIMPK